MQLVHYHISLSEVVHSLVGAYSPLSFHFSFPANSTLRQLRRVLILVDLQEVRPVMVELCHSDAMSATRVFTLPGLQDVEEDEIFASARLPQPSQLRIIKSEILLSGISEYIFHTWGIQIDPDELDLRWCDITGNNFAVRSYQSIIQLLTEHRPSWWREQDEGPLLPSAPLPDPVNCTSCDCRVTRPFHPDICLRQLISDRKEKALMLPLVTVDVSHFLPFFFLLFFCSLLPSFNIRSLVWLVSKFCLLAISSQYDQA